MLTISDKGKCVVHSRLRQFHAPRIMFVGFAADGRGVFEHFLSDGPELHRITHENVRDWELALPPPLSLQEQVKLLREALQKAHEGLDSAARYFDKLDSQTVVEAVEEALQTVSTTLEATKEGG